MPTEAQAIPAIIDPFITRLSSERKAALNFQKRRFEAFSENYELYRDTVQINRLTQRQAVNIPLMKETIKTLLSSIDEAPDIYFQELDNNLEKEYVLNEFWSYEADRINLTGLDIQDKKNVLLYGFSVKKLNIADDGISATALDPYDIVFDPLMEPSDIETARFIVHQNIFKTIREILADERYDEEGKQSLKIWAVHECQLQLRQIYF